MFHQWVLAVLLLGVQHLMMVNAQLTITVSTWGSSTGGNPNTFIGTGNQIASSLLGSAEPALMWGVVASSDVNSVCEEIVNTGGLSFAASVIATTGITSTLEFQVSAIGGCLAAADGSGTQAVLVDSNGRKSAVVCPNTDAGSTGCGVYLCGSDVEGLYSQVNNRRRLLTSRRILVDNCAASGAVNGAITGFIGSVATCASFGPLAPFCAVGMVGVSAGFGAAGQCAGDAAAGCFPGDATVLLVNGELKPMSKLALGDKVAVRKREGVIAYEDVYAFGHKDAIATSYYIRLSVSPMGANVSDFRTQVNSLELTPGHFMPVSSDLGGQKILYKRANDVLVGDLVWGQRKRSDALTSPYVVTDITRIVKKGLYNPFTLSGTIIVNGIAASTHSDWFLDQTFDFLHLTHQLPNAYQIVLYPARALYYLLGNEMYISAYNQLDSLIDMATFGTKFGGSIIGITLAVSTIAGMAIMISN